MGPWISGWWVGGQVLVVGGSVAGWSVVGGFNKTVKKISGATRNCVRWSVIEAVKLPEIILGRAILEKISVMFWS